MFIYSLYVAEDINTLLMYPLNAQQQVVEFEYIFFDENRAAM